MTRSRLYRAAALVLGFGCAQAQAPADLRVALVIGNAAYAAAPLATPANDARVMSETLRALGFTVVEARDASKMEMEAALVRARDAMKAGNAVGMLYYSGHALQLGWRNYMVPVDAKLSGPKDVAASTVDVQRIVEAFKSSGNRMNIFVLDASRENPFGLSASGRGLAPMDAPPDSLLAYSATPGEVAEDGAADNGHGLYTQHLLRELRQPSAKIEDVFKRVRYQVRKQSQGRQVPWESTSLESDFYFDPGYRSSVRLGEEGNSDASTARAGELNVAPVRVEPVISDLMVGGTRLVGAFDASPRRTGYAGTGKLIWPNGDAFEGTLVDGKREGRGTFVWSNGQRYEGDWQQDRPNGQGAMWFSNGDHYEGAIEAGEPNGQGRLRYASGDRYFGQVVKGLPFGPGVYTWLSGQSLAGDWVNGQPKGSGTMRFVSGDLYEGAVEQGRPNGRGRMLFLSQDTYTGTYKDGRPDGEGTYTWKNGDKYVGQWKDGMKDGHGVFTWRNGDRWEGLFRADALLEGTLTRKQE